MNQKIHPAKISGHLGGKALQRAFVAHISHEIGVLLHIDHGDVRAILREFLRNRPANALRAARHDGDFPCEHALSSPRRFAPFRTVEKPKRGAKSFRTSIVPGGVYGGGGAIFCAGKFPFSRAKIASLQFPRPEIRRISAETGRGVSGGGACSPVHQLVKKTFLTSCETLCPFPLLYRKKLTGPRYGKTVARAL